MYRLNRYLDIELMKEQYTGFGPKLELAIPNIPVKLWFSLLNINKN